jgi:dihydrofolate synthase/folylpolyglutamate synthase
MMTVKDQILYELCKGKDYHIEPTLERIEKAVEYVGLKEPS